MTETLEERIDRLTAERRSAWREGRPARALSAEIEQAWEELRRTRAERVHGATAAIVQRARVERELEKLMAEEA